MTNHEIEFLTCTYECMKDYKKTVMEFCRMIYLAFPTIEKASKADKTIEKLAHYLDLVNYSLVTSNDFDKNVTEVSEKTDLQINNATALMLRIINEVRKDERSLL